LFLDVRLVAVDRGLAGTFALPVALGLVARFAGAGLAGARLGFAFSSAATSAMAGSGCGVGGVAGSGSVDATPTELDRVRWHVSQLTIVRTSAPR